MLQTGWQPFIIDRLYLDDIDHHGIFWIAEAIKQENEKMKKDKNKK